MKTTTYNSLGIDVPFQVPETVEEFDRNAKKAGACLGEAINNVIYRGSLAEFRDLFLHGRDAKDGVEAFKGLETLTSIERTTEPVLDKDGKPRTSDGKPLMKYSETEADYFKRVCALQGKKPEDYQTLANETAALISFDASAKERKAPEPKTLSQKHKDSAKVVLNKYDDNQIEKNVRKNAPDWVHTPFARTGDEVKDLETLGWFLKEYDKNKPIM